MPATSIHSSHPLFDELPPDERARIDDYLQVERRRQGERFGGEVETSSLLLVSSGRVRVFVAGPDDRELTLALLDPGEAFGAAPSLAGRQRRIEALEHTMLISFSEADLARLVESAPTFGIRVVRLLLESARGVSDDLARLAFSPVPARLAAKLVELMDRYGRVTPSGIRIDVRFTHLQLSAMIGTSRETLTKALGDLRANGIVDVRERLIWVLDADGLEAAAVIG